MSQAERLTVGDVLLLRQLAAAGAVAYVGTGAGAEQRLDALGDARRRALALLGPKVREEHLALCDDLRSNQAKAEPSLEDEAERDVLLARLTTLLGQPAGVDAAQATAPSQESPPAQAG